MKAKSLAISWVPHLSLSRSAIVLLSVSVLLGVALVGAGCSSGRELTDRGDGSVGAHGSPGGSSSGPAEAIRVSWIDFEQSRKRAGAKKSEVASRKVGISHLVLVTPTFGGGKFARDLERGRLAGSTKVLDSENMRALLDAFESQGFFEHSQDVKGESLADQTTVKAVITVERDGQGAKTLVHTKGAGADRKGRKVIETFRNCKELFRGAYNVTTQFSHVTIKQE